MTREELIKEMLAARNKARRYKVGSTDWRACKYFHGYYAAKLDLEDIKKSTLYYLRRKCNA